MSTKSGVPQSKLPNDAYTNYSLYLFAEHHKDRSTALKSLHSAYESGNAPLSVYEQLSAHYEQAGDYDKALEIVKRAKDDTGADTELLPRMIKIHERKGEVFASRALQIKCLASADAALIRRCTQ